ncbi:MAG: hypothetical protein IJ555_10575 [Ruminococcus sp.]|nr:hypothetical protein [Ruminococcus sp.]
MSIRIYMEIDARKINKEKWSAIFNDCLKIAEFGQLADIEKRNVCGHNINCLVPVKEKDGMLRVAGDLVQGKFIEEYHLMRDVDIYVKSTCPEGEISVTEFLYNRFKNIQEDVNDTYTMVFGNLTNGARAHIYLLAMACLIVDSFPEATVVHGSISYGQCEEACEITEEATGKKIGLPIQFSYSRLYAKLVGVSWKENDLLNRFLTLYKGRKDENFKSFLKEHFTEEQFMDSFEHYESGKVWELIRDWLQLGLSLDGLCELFMRLEDRYSVNELVDYLIIGKVHVKDKSLYDFTDTCDELNIIDDITMSEARQNAKNYGVERKVINAYIPIEEIRDTLRRHFPDSKTDKIIDNALAGKGKRFEEQKEIEKLYEFVASESQSIFENEDEIIDIAKLYQLGKEKPLLHKFLWEEILYVSQFFNKFGEVMLTQPQFKELCQRRKYMSVLLNSKYHLPEETAEHILNIADDTKYAALYFGLLGSRHMPAYTDPIRWALLMNRELYDKTVEALDKE